jgi:hypothetical protein
VEGWFVDKRGLIDIVFKFLIVSFDLVSVGWVFGELSTWIQKVITKGPTSHAARIGKVVFPLRL